MGDLTPEQLFEQAARGEIDAEDLGAKLSAMVEAEASAAEAETPDTEDEEGAEAEEVTQPDPILDALGVYLGVVQETLGADAPIKPCAYCHGMGFNPIELKQDSHSNICGDCDGFGEVITGSKVSGNEARMCPTCHGSGYIAETAQIGITVAGDQAAQVQVLSDAEVAQIVADAQRVAGVNAS